MKKIGEKVSLAILTFIYLLCSLRYFPDQPGKSLVETAIHLLTIAPFLIGSLLVFNSIYQKQVGERPTKVRMFRLCLTLGIAIEFFIGLYHYLSTAKAANL